ncbi:MAG TPA: hypothetical protein VGO84_11450 [Burkholderiales bacterium]|nr:hypothetical protein [Burkholderiales bacterium]
MIPVDSVQLPYRALRVAVFALLTGNTLYYLYAGTLSKGLDAVAWLLLLALFALETGRAPHVLIAMRVLRLLAALGVGLAGVGYLLEKDTLDAVNTALWIGVVILLELQVRRPQMLAHWRAGFTAMAALLYSGLALLVLIWGWRGEWFDAYDALLWLTAFATIEMDVLAPVRPAAAG